MPDRTIPIIRFEIEGMRRTLYTMISEYNLKIDEQVKLSLDRFCEEGHIQRIIDETTNSVLSEVIKQEVSRWYTIGAGREIIKKAILDKLSNDETYTPLDDNHIY